MTCRERRPGVVSVFRAASAVALLLTAAPSAQSPQTQAASPPCSAPEYRQFDFWMGEWEVFARDGKKAGENRITPILAGCAIEEQWTGASGGGGRSLTTYSPADQRWRQLYADSTGLVLELRGGFDGTAIVLESVPPADGRPVARHRIRWSRESDGSVRQHWRMSKDAGVTWIEIFDGRYHRKPA